MKVTRWGRSTAEKRDAIPFADAGDTAFRSTYTSGCSEASRGLDDKAARTDSAVDLASAGGTMERMAEADVTICDSGRDSTPADSARETVSALYEGVRDDIRL
jgi:hypothetical protein